MKNNLTNKNSKAKHIINEKHETKEYKHVSLFKNPIITTVTLLEIIAEKLILSFKYIFSKIQIIFLILIVVLMNFIENPFTDHIVHLRKILYTCLYWIILGIASSIGLGTGLHTFVLYLGPHIAKVTLAANECSYFPEMNPSRWEFEDFLPCNLPSTEENYTSFLTILMNIQLEAFMWGIGTAIGELPPYFMALAASKSGKNNEELNEIIEKEQNIVILSLIDRVKVYIFEHLKNHGFITVLICASVRKII